MLHTTAEAGERSPADPVEGREYQAKEPLEGTMSGISRSTNVSTKLQRIAELASQTPKMVLTSLAHHIDVEWLREAYRRTRKDGAVGIDGRNAEDYAANLDANLAMLLDRFKSGTYRAPPVKRVHIPKGNGAKTRPIGVPTFEDKVLQRAVAMVLDAVYEQDFMDCSYGFRPGRSAHDALDTLWKGLMDMGGGYVVELDIESFFDTLDHSQLRSFLDQRIRDGVVRRVLGKWLKAGVLEEGAIRRSTKGTPQGGVVSPILANIYLHEVLDVWFARDVQPRMRGHSFMIRYADDALLVFSSEEDAHRVLDVLPKRFAKFGLRLHPEKTRLVEFRRPPRAPTKRRSETFDFLGFTVYWDTSRRGYWVVKRRTSSKSLRGSLKRITAWCRLHRHRSVRDQHTALSRKLRGHYAYFGITGNAPALSTFLRQVERIWRKWLDRRSNQSRMEWDRFTRLLGRYQLPPVRVVHSVYTRRSPRLRSRMR